MREFTLEEIREFITKRHFDADVILNKDSSWPRISIVTPSYNQAEFLERTILSVLNQNYPNIEYIIIDGGSNDGSVQIIEKYQKFLTYWVSEKDDGQSHALNKGFEKSTGEILAYINSDDTYDPGALFKIAAAFKANPHADIVFGNVAHVNKEDQVVGECRFTPFSFASLIYEGGALHQPGAFWGRAAHERVNGMNPKYQFCMDYDFFCRVAEHGNLKYIREHIANFRLHETSKSLTLTEQGFREHEEIVTRYRRTNNHYLVAFRRALCRLYRMCQYVLQGDLDYVLRGVARRLTGAQANWAQAHVKGGLQ